MDLKLIYFNKERGTHIIVSNLWEDDEGKLELDFEADDHQGNVHPFTNFNRLGNTTQRLIRTLEGFLAINYPYATLSQGHEPRKRPILKELANSYTNVCSTNTTTEAKSSALLL
ncbi:hypothetical protein COLO4_28790 [Corchorus olitorius]|uniref:Uncharacterized protein n=1 Tax=Corchorus olitorius TaxID=93759 RepID=A0A1R3HIA0_9ROSI|nr:hypothetical protein COLO4_28790 [Corchorus olitorius]